MQDFLLRRSWDYCAVAHLDCHASCHQSLLAGKSSRWSHASLQWRSSLHWTPLQAHLGKLALIFLRIYTLCVCVCVCTPTVCQNSKLFYFFAVKCGDKRVATAVSAGDAAAADGVWRLQAGGSAHSEGFVDMDSGTCHPSQWRNMGKRCEWVQAGKVYLKVLLPRPDFPSVRRRPQELRRPILCVDGS